jgi:hypothetical protein
VYRNPASKGCAANKSLLEGATLLTRQVPIVILTHQQRSKGLSVEGAWAAGALEVMEGGAVAQGLVAVEEDFAGGALVAAALVDKAP